MKNTPVKRVVSIFLALMILVSCIPLSVLAAPTAQSPELVADENTLDAWKDLFLQSPLNTNNAGMVWTDKSVMTDALAFRGTGITKKDDKSFLIALSAMGSNMSVTGMSNVPTDTMLVLDVSGSMNQGSNNVARELVEAANESIKTLLEMSKHNRVGVVLYSGPTTQNGAASANDAILLLPLGRYTNASGNFLTYTYDDGGWFSNDTETISVSNSTYIENTNTRPASVSKQVVGATYIQKGVILAKDQFVANGNSTSIEDPVLGTITRKPIVVLMSDGAPTVGSSTFTNPSSYNLGDGTSGSANAALGFVTQLSAAYAKQQIEEKYNTECLFYTLGLGTGNDNIATSVLNPQNSSSAIDDLWEDYNRLNTGSRTQVRNGVYVTKIADTLKQEYVNEYFEVSSSSNDIAKELKDAFKEIVGTIQLQSRYFPTLVSGNEDLSGYVTFSDQLGEYMEVTDIKGILIHNQLFSGKNIARNFREGNGGGELGTTDNPTALGHEMVAAVQARLGLSNIDAARTLIELAFQYKQLSYVDDNNFSNYIGWYANARGEFLGFWYEGATTLPPVTGNVDTDPVYTVKSYGFLGEVDEEHGVVPSDMMYASVQVREEITSGNQTVTFSVPAALIPVLTYNVTLEEDRDAADLEVSGAEHPIRLVYEAGLKKGINSFNLLDKITPAYYAANRNADGSVRFYSNKYEADFSTGYGTANTISYFNPSRQNEKYYYLEDTPIYTNENGTLYQGTTAPDVNGSFYRSYTIYEKSGNNVSKKTVYRQMSAFTLETARAKGDGTWYIPAGDIHSNVSGYTVDKQNPATTGTLPQVYLPFVDTHNHRADDTGYSFYVGATLGNNGLMNVMPETGIKLTKVLAENTPATDRDFNFVIEHLNSSFSSTVSALRILADGTEREETVTFGNGAASVTLKAGEILYIGGMTAGETCTVREVATADYVAEDESIDVTVVNAAMVSANFTNALRGKGNLTVTKEIVHSLGANYTVPATLKFQVKITLSGIGVQNATFQGQITGDVRKNYTTDANGSLTVQLGHNEQFELFELPEGTVATVVEENQPSYFTPSYVEGTVAGDGVVTIEGDNTASVLINNTYSPASVSPANVRVNGEKFILNHGWEDAYSFKLQLERQDGNSWTKLGEAVVSKNNPTFNFDSIFAAESYTEAKTYYYRIIEIEPENPIEHITYDKTVHAFGVVVGDADMDGRLEITQVRSYRTSTVVTSAQNIWNVEVDFTNTYWNDTPAEVTVDLNKTVTDLSYGSDLASPEGFRFQLLDATGGVVKTSEYTTWRGFARMVLSFDREGTYRYTLVEDKSNPKPYWTYSTNHPNGIPVVVVVTRESGNLVAKIDTGENIGANATSSVSVTFTNEYNPADATLALDFVTKEMDGRDLTANDVFNFTVREVGGSTVATGTNDATGKVTFDKDLGFDRVGTRFFEIVETGTDRDGITFDKTIHTIQVTVADVNGKLTASYIVLDSVENTITFTNRYKAAETSLVIGGEKILDGRFLLNEEFIFILTEATDANGTTESLAKTWQAANFTDGSFRFDAITYTDEGTYYYTVTEQQPRGATNGIVFDTTEYVITVVVEDNGLGKLEVVKNEVRIKGQSTTATLEFNNIYSPAPAKATLRGNKLLEGRDLAKEEFDFELYNSSASWETLGLKESVSNDEDGTFAFSEITLSTAGSHYFLVKEAGGGSTLEGVTYDSTVYHVRIDVTDDLMGQLHAVVHMYDENLIPRAFLNFENTYKVTGSVPLNLVGKKTLDGRDLSENEFTFLLTPANELFAVDAEAIAFSAKNKADGTFSFENVSFSAPGKYYFVVTEDATAPLENVSYDTAVYHVTVEVIDNGKGALEIRSTTLAKKDSTEAVSEIAFTNTYTAPPAPPAPPINPPTGDTANLNLWLSVLFVSGTVLFGSVFIKKKKNVA